MYKINTTTNSIEKLEERLFGDLSFRERDHLQEWIAKNPESLNEELLIIQKEFSGFDDTNERLDLLALDKDGNLVIIENKLDDSGRDVVWQALKYTSYCSTLITKQIIKIYQDYLDANENGEDARTSIMDFLQIEDESELFLNTKDQRIVFVANHYRKEVTSTVLWLLDHDIQVQCFRATPYSMDEQLFLQIEQIIPVPETKELMVSISEKKKESNSKSKAIGESEVLLVKFWSGLKRHLEENDLHYLDAISAKPYYNIGFWKGHAVFRFVLGRHANRVELYFNQDSDKKIIDTMFLHKDEIESKFGKELQWERLDNKKASRIKFDTPEEITESLANWRDSDNWKPRMDWFSDEFDLFYKAISPVWEKVQSELKKES
ncbi:DUF4268 domain-containing protein [Candidatus Woesearchaeota archaeon]|jgi:hypothetical protein|nr:DUF4268 domain-containing protein [Candidatus Woesearchaeota archaeon]MBT7558887.1 DUF4268 domain-containing protein [Candidatus Woesearchaeota archaeon]